MREIFARLWSWFTKRRSQLIRVVAAQPLAAGVTVYVLAMNDRRIVLAASAHGLCVLDRYTCEAHSSAEGQRLVSA